MEEAFQDTHYEQKAQRQLWNIVESAARSETFAKHMESIQWAVRPVTAMGDCPQIGQLHTNDLEITSDEMLTAVKQLKSKRAAIQTPAEYLKAAVQNPCGREWLLELMQLCWQTKTTPRSWHISEVVLIYKKGTPTDCNNYRPISLVSVLYKVYAKILLNRLKDAGAEPQLWRRQFGFRSGCSTEDALFIVRRRIEQAWASRGGRTFLLALDWRKAFDCIEPSRLMHALKRFGLSDAMLSAIAEIYKDRVFEVRDGGTTSTKRLQLAGISQGCPLSPFLFGMLMTVLMHDAKNSLSHSAKQAYEQGDLEDVLFADDTLLISTTGAHLEEYMSAVTACGAHYGLQVHWDKVHFVPVSTDQGIKGPCGQSIPAQESMIYLGSTIHRDGKFGSEISRKIGKAAAKFKSLQTAWKHASISRRRKLQLFESYVQSQLR